MYYKLYYLHLQKDTTYVQHLLLQEWNMFEIDLVLACVLFHGFDHLYSL